MIDTARFLAAPPHDGAALHVVDDAPSLGDVVPVFVRVPHSDGADQLWLRTAHDAEPSISAGRVDRRTDAETWWRFDVDVRNPVTTYRFLLDGGPRGYRWLNGTGPHAHDVTDASDFRLTVAPPPPAWARDAYVYQIFPDRFARSVSADGRERPSWAVPAGWDDTVVFRGPATARQLFGGDLDGIIEHLDHIGSVGANTIYLTPFFPAESNHRYNASSFAEVDPLLGGDFALARLATAVHDRGWRLLGDLTTNHSGDTHPWFRAALADRDARERDYFYFDPDSDAYEGWLGHASLPKIRHSSKAVRRLLVSGPDSVAARWLRPPYALDGWRVDVANMTGRHRGDDLNAVVAHELRATMAAVSPESLLVAEHCHDASGDLSGEGWHGAMNYAGFTRPLWAWLRGPGPQPYGYLGLPTPVPALGAQSFVAAVRAFAAAAPWRSMITSWSLLGSHDSARIRTVVGDADRGEVAAGLLFTLPGTPMVFAGDEIGEVGITGEDARRPFPWHRRDTWDVRTLGYYRALAELRRSNDALRRGGLRWAHAEGDALVYLRESPDQRVLVLAARASHAPVSIPATLLGTSGAASSLYGAAEPLTISSDEMITLPGDGPTFQVWQLAA